MPDLATLRAVLDAAADHNLRRVRFGDIEVEWAAEGSRKVASAAPEPAGDTIAIPEPSPEELAMWSSNAYTTTAPKK